MAQNEEPDQLAELMRERIAARLATLKLTPITAATKAKIPRDTIRNLFRTGSLPRLDTLVRISEALETTVAYLVGETAYPFNDYSDEDKMAAARVAIETAKPVPLIGYAEWGFFEVPRQGFGAIDVLHLNVPGFEDKPLSAVQVVDEHCNVEFESGVYVIFAWRDSGVGLRDGDFVVVLHRKEINGKMHVEFTVRHQDYGITHTPSGHRMLSSRLLSLALDTEKYPDWDRYSGSRSTVFPAEPPDRGWTTAESLAGESAPSDTMEELGGAIAAGKGDEAGPPYTDSLEVIGVVVASLTTFVRPAGPALFPRIGLSVDDELTSIDRSGTAEEPPDEG